MPPAPGSGRGRPAKRLRRDETHRPVSVKALAMELAPDHWQEITWREGSNAALTSRFARLRVRPAHGDTKHSEPAAEEWLLIEWPGGEAEPDHYWLSTLPADISFERMVDLTKMRWRIGACRLSPNSRSRKLGSAAAATREGRGWRGFNLSPQLSPRVAAYGFLLSEKETIPPQDLPAPGEARNRPFPPVIDPEDLPLRSQRHMPNSIATLRIRLARTLVHVLPQCPCCGRARQWPVEQHE